MHLNAGETIIWEYTPKKVHFVLSRVGILPIIFFIISFIAIKTIPLELSLYNSICIYAIINATMIFTKKFSTTIRYKALTYALTDQIIITKTSFYKFHYLNKKLNPLNNIVSYRYSDIEKIKYCDIFLFNYELFTDYRFEFGDININKIDNTVALGAQTKYINIVNSLFYNDSDVMYYSSFLNGFYGVKDVRHIIAIIDKHNKDQRSTHIGGS